MFCNLFGTLACPDGIPCVESFKIEVPLGAQPCTKIIWWEFNYCIGRDHALASGITSSTVFVPMELPQIWRYSSPHELPHLRHSSQRDYLKYRIRPNGTTSDMVFMPLMYIVLIPKPTSYKVLIPKELDITYCIHPTGNTSSRVFIPNIFMGRTPLHSYCQWGTRTHDWRSP
jgi:hypothetical protein